MILSTKKDKIAFTKVLSGISGNLSAGFFGLILLAPNFLPIKGALDILLLTVDLFAGILFMWLSYKLERSLL